MPVYRIEVSIAATAYVRAPSERAAHDAVCTHDCEGSEDGFAEYYSSLPYDDPDLPDFSLSPAMTLLTLDSKEVEKVD